MYTDYIRNQDASVVGLLRRYRPACATARQGLALHSRVFYAECMAVHAYRTVAEAIRDLERRGFTANFEMVNKTFRAVDSGKTFTPDDLAIVEHYRFEGASDPEELAVVYAIQARDGTRGSLVDAYGAYANPELSAFLKDVPIHET
ncbi:MAG TPA: hypothetical protein PKA61_15410 [Nitrospira sp.]|nr:hypothetical protein [Nitrospira sp.]